MDTFRFTLASGRVVGGAEFGNRSSSDVVVLCHPAPGSSLFDPDPDATTAANVRVIALDRPGYGPSQLDGGGPVSVRRAAEDVAEYLDEQGITTASAVGWSAGGRVALALAAAQPEVVCRVAVVATPAPDSEVPWVGDDNRAVLESFRSMSSADATAALTAFIDEYRGAKPTGAALLADLTTPGADGPLLMRARDRLIDMLDRAAEQGNVGMAADMVSYTLMDLGFELDRVRAKTLLLYGGGDPAVGERHATWHEQRIANARIEVVAGAGHLVVVPSWHRVLAHLVPPE
ncbi:alpha/beta fold hydrolase [Glaciihabitans sp. dw_435]|uniref:alpha/beta fold hydrolase n=1 Tax=Glaciihabitans sp. dw_435 TaxID=2720081 RepID=UPI001BD273BF|nr:alpha/beta hydrolase [Glaciihabitans sp. dw_435]